MASNNEWGHKLVLKLDFTFADVYKQLSDALNRPPTVNEVRRVFGHIQLDLENYANDLQDGAVEAIAKQILHPRTEEQ